MSAIDTNIETISEKLLDYLRDVLEDPDIEFGSSLAQLQGGYETFTFRFTLKGAGEKLSQPLVLRLYPAFYGTRNAVWESTVQNALVDEGFPAAKAHFVCTDMGVLGGAFFIMDYIPGEPLMFAQPEKAPELMGKTHAELHRIDPKPLVGRLDHLGIDGYVYSFGSRIDWLKDKSSEHAWIREGVRWLVDHRPPEPGRLVICHGDFHPLNIMVHEGRVSGVLDWPGFAVADPVFDVANTLVIITIPAKYITASLEGFASIDWNLVAETYLNAYQSEVKLDRTNLAYYRVRRCLMALVQGVEGQKIWQHPMIAADLARYIHQITGVPITVPAAE